MHSDSSVRNASHGTLSGGRLVLPWRKKMHLHTTINQETQQSTEAQLNCCGRDADTELTMVVKVS